MNSKGQLLLDESVKLVNQPNENLNKIRQFGYKLPLIEIELTKHQANQD